MKAITLTCDKNHFCADHMVQCYEDLWPDHPFVFRIPYESNKGDFKEKYGDRVQLIKVPSPEGKSSHIKTTVLKLLEDLDEEEMVYWSIDDKYPVHFHKKLYQLTNWIQENSNSSIDGVSFSRRCLQGNYIRNRVYKFGGNIALVRRSDYSGIWVHQFLRVRVLKELFNAFPDRPFAAKKMDSFKGNLALSSNTHLYGTLYTYAIFGESMSRGKLTGNCFRSMREKLVSIPSECEVEDIDYTIGSIYRNICGVNIPYWWLTPLRRIFGR